MPQVAAADLFSLSIPERIQLVEDIRDSIAVHPEMVVLTQDNEATHRKATFRGVGW